MSEQTDLAEAEAVVGGGVAFEAEDGAHDREGEALRTNVRDLTAKVIDLEFEHMDLEQRLAASEAYNARLRQNLERFHREQAVARAAAGPNTGANQENEET